MDAGTAGDADISVHAGGHIPRGVAAGRRSAPRGRLPPAARAHALPGRARALLRAVGHVAAPAAGHRSRQRGCPVPGRAGAPVRARLGPRRRHGRLHGGAPHGGPGRGRAALQAAVRCAPLPGSARSPCLPPRHQGAKCVSFAATLYLLPSAGKEVSDVQVLSSHNTRGGPSK